MSENDRNTDKQGTKGQGQDSKGSSARNKYRNDLYKKKQRDKSSQKTQDNRNIKRGTKPDSQGKQNVRKQKPQFHKERSNFSISVIVPLLNEEESLQELASQLEKELKKLVQSRYEVIFVDDGSTDSSFSVLRRINKENNRFKAYRFRRNYGKAAALSLGFSKAQGDFVITMDADLQDDPAEIPNLINRMNDGYDLVSGWKKKRKDPFAKKFWSKFFNFATSMMSGVKLHDHNCGLKAYRKEVVKTLKIYGEMHRYIPALAHWEGFRISEVPVLHHPRKYGKTKYGLSRFVKGFLDLLTIIFTTRYVKRPLHFFGTIGSLFVLVGFATDLWLTIEWAMEKTSLSNRPLLFMGIALIIVGVQFISMGLLAELITKNSQEKENYSIKERL